MNICYRFVFVFSVHILSFDNNCHFQKFFFLSYLDCAHLRVMPPTWALPHAAQPMNGAAMMGGGSVWDGQYERKKWISTFRGVSTPVIFKCRYHSACKRHFNGVARSTIGLNNMQTNSSYVRCELTQWHTLPVVFIYSRDG